MSRSDLLLARLRADFPDCIYARVIESLDGKFMSMVAAGENESWRVLVTTRHSYSVAPSEQSFVIKYGQYTQFVEGTLEDAEERMWGIIGGMSCHTKKMDVPVLAYLVIALIVASLAFWCWK